MGLQMGDEGHMGARRGVEWALNILGPSFRFRYKCRLVRWQVNLGVCIVRVCLGVGQFGGMTPYGGQKAIF